MPTELTITEARNTGRKNFLGSFLESVRLLRTQKGEIMYKKSLSLVIAVSVGACQTPEVPDIMEPTLGMSLRETTSAICDNRNLDSQILTMRRRADEAALALQVYRSREGGTVRVNPLQRSGAGAYEFNQSGGYSGTRIRSEDFDNKYKLRDRLKAFDAELDIAYQDMTSSCKTYAACMSARFYEEGDCRSAFSQWESSRRNFSSMAVELRRLEADIARAKAAAAQRARRRANQNQADVNREQDCRRNGSLGGVFSTC